MISYPLSPNDICINKKGPTRDQLLKELLNMYMEIESLCYQMKRSLKPELECLYRKQLREMKQKFENAAVVNDKRMKKTK